VLCCIPVFVRCGRSFVTSFMLCVMHMSVDDCCMFDRSICEVVLAKKLVIQTLYKVRKMDRQLMNCCIVGFVSICQLSKQI